MNRFCNPLRLLAAAAVAVAVMGVPNRAEAGFFLRVSTNGGASFAAPVSDGGTGAIVLLIGNVSVKATSNSITTSDVSFIDLHLDGFANKGTNIVVQAMLTDLVTVPAPQQLTTILTSSSFAPGVSLSAQTWLDNSNGSVGSDFGTSGAGIVLNTGTLLPGSTGVPVFSGNFPGVTPYSITTQLKVSNVTTLSSIQLDVNNMITPAPAPAGLVLALAGVPAFGFGTWLRRRRAASPVQA
jgi:hypothetical protein